MYLPLHTTLFNTGIWFFKVEVLNNEVSRLISRLKDVETDLTNSQDRCSAQADDLRQKSSKIPNIFFFTFISWGAKHRT